MTTSSISGPGAYGPCGVQSRAPTGETYDSTNAQYFYKHEDLKWVPTQANRANRVAGAVKVRIYNIGRKWMWSENGTYQQVGRVYAGRLYYKIPGQNTEVWTDGDIDILACVPCTNGGSGEFLISS